MKNRALVIAAVFGLMMISSKATMADTDSFTSAGSATTTVSQVLWCPEVFGIELGCFQIY